MNEMKMRNGGRKWNEKLEGGGFGENMM